VDADLSPVAASEAGFGDIATLFGESASRVVVSVENSRTAELLTLAAREGVPATAIGRVGGDRIRMSIAGRRVLDEPLAEIEQVWSTVIDRYFERAAAIA
jgi:phosphoribosylformylglycinamidine synthase